MLSLGRSLAPVPLRLAARRAPLPDARRWNQQASAGSHALDPLDATRRKLLYRSKQRGWLEMDIMLGNWAAANLPRLQEAELQQFQEVIDMENPDLYKMLTGQQAVPDDVANPLLRTLCADLKRDAAPKVTVQSTAAFEGKVWE